MQIARSVVAYSAAWNKSHPEQYKKNKKFHEQKRRARKLKALGTHLDSSGWLESSSTDGSVFIAVLKLTPKTLRKDHRIALTRGGRDVASNLVPACHSCNSQKHAMTPAEFARRRAGSN